jgi:hypothetical protein
MDTNVNIGRTDEEYLAILGDRIIECICREILSKNMTWFHGVDMIRKCVRLVQAIHVITALQRQDIPHHSFR